MSLLQSVQSEPVPLRAARGRDRRSSERYDLTGVSGVLIHDTAKLPCEVLDISLDGCQVQTRERFPHGALARVEVNFELFGMMLRAYGVTQWTHQEQRVGVRFIHPNARARNELASLLACLMDEALVADVQAALAEQQTDPTRPRILFSTAKISPAARSVPVALEAKKEEPAPSGPAEVFDWKAEMLVIRDNHLLHGTIVEVRMDGCSFELSSPWREEGEQKVEVVFRMRGLPIRLGGLVSSSEDAHIVMIRFDEMSSRRRDQLEELVQEVREAIEKARSEGQ